MKKILTLLLTATLIFSACGGGKSNVSSEDEPYFYTYKTSEFTIAAPDTWDTQTAFTSDYPDSLRVAFKNNIKESDFVANVTVIREDNKNDFTNFDYSQEKLDSHSDSLLNFKLLSQEEVKLYVGSSESSTYLNTFQGKNTSSGPTLEFMQVNLTKGSHAWTVTATYMPEEDDFVIERMDKMLKSFALR
ncbi:hypothetical protein KKC94_01505 [Patescibacteria group bacterium]|nr:hypothetical protein [Patescibacteria group bacterium]